MQKKTARVSNRRKSAIYSFAQNSLQASLENAFLIDRAYQLEIDLTPCRINTNAIANRRWIAMLPIARIARFLGAIARGGLLRFSAGERGREAERDQHSAGEVALRAAQARAAANAFRERPGEQRVHRVAAPAHHRKQNSQLANLQRGVTARRVDELRQERQKKQRGLRIEQGDQHALREDSRQQDRE